MAKTKASAEAVRLLHANGAAVSVSADKADRLLAGGQFTSEGDQAAAKPARTRARRSPTSKPDPTPDPGE